MKRFLALAALVLGLAACQTEPEGLNVNVGGEVDTVVSVSLPEATRATSDVGFNIADTSDNYEVRYILEIYLGDSCQRHIKVADGASVAFPVRLAPGRDYTFVAWADIVEKNDDRKKMEKDRYYYTTSDRGLRNISIIEDKWNAMDESRDAFTAKETRTGFSAQAVDLHLKRPFAKLRVVATDREDVVALGLTPATATITYSQAMPREYNALTNTVSEASAKTHTITYPTPYTDEDGEYTLFADYFFVPTEGVAKFSLDVYAENDTTPIKHTDFNTDIYVAANKLTTIKGDVLTTGANIKIDVNGDMDTPSYEYDIWDGESETEPEVITGESGTPVAIIDSGSDLAWFAGYVNGINSFNNASIASTRATKNMDFVLTANIDLDSNEWTPIGNKAHHFDGTFDGNGHTIKGLRVTKIHDNGEQAALFGTMSGHPVIKNLVVDEAYIKYPNDGKDFYASAIAGTIYGYVTFENITVKNSTITGNNKVGAIFAHDGSSNKITINNCHVDNCYIASEDLEDGGNVGGLIGLFQTGSTEVCTISNSSVKNSTIVGINSSNTGKRANSQFIGGILTKDNTNLVLENCVVEKNTFSQTTDGTNAVTYQGDFDGVFIGGDRAEKCLGFVMINGNLVCHAGYEKLTNYPNVFVKDGNYYVFGVAGLRDLNNYFKANWCGNNTWTPEYNIAADIDATGFTWDGVYLNVGWNGNNGIVLNGNGHTISNLTINNYLLSGTPCGGNDGVSPGLVKDITMKNTVVEGSSHDAAIFWGNCFTNVDFENVTVDGAKIKGGSNVGALVSRTSIEGPNTEIKVNFKNCVVKNSTLEANNTNADPNGASGFIGRTYGNTKLTFEGCSVENNTINNAEGLVGGAVYGYTTWYGDGFYGTGACDTFTNWNGLVVASVSTVDELNGAIASDKTVIIGATIEDATIKLPANLKNFTLKAAEGVSLKNTTISASDGNAYHYENLTFDGITFDNSRILLTGWRNGEEVIKNLTVTNCVFQNLDDTTNTAPVHINKDASEAIENFTFTNNVINGATGGSKSGVYAQVTGTVVFENNVINNVSFRPYVIQITTDDAIADTFTVRGNTFSGSAKGRAQGLGSNAAGTDKVSLVVSGNIFKDITEAQQICYWDFNAATTTADLSKNYYDIDIEANPSRIYYNAAASSVEDLKAMGVYPFYTELNADGTINLNSLKQAE